MRVLPSSLIMERDIEMNALKHAVALPDTSSGQILDKMLAKQAVDASSNSKPRSRLRMFAILTALFVGCQLPGENFSVADHISFLFL